MKKAEAETLIEIQWRLVDVFHLMNAWADPDRKYMNDWSRYDANQILGEVYARLAQIHQLVDAAVTNPEHRPILSVVRKEIAEAEETLRVKQGLIPTRQKLGKREIEI